MTKPRAVAGDVFAGLFAAGVRSAGFDVVAHLEHSSYGAKTARMNWPELDVRVGVENWAPKSLGRVDFFFCNPPCAPWSGWNTKGNWRDDPRLSWPVELIAAGIEMKAKTFAWESIIGAWTKGKTFVVEQLRTLAAAGYSTTILLQNNMYLGAPQNRKRVFVLAHKHPLPFRPLVEPKTTREWLKGVRVPEAERRALIEMSRGKGWDDIWKISKKTGHKYFAHIFRDHQHEARFKKCPRPSFMVTRVDPDKPPNLITGHQWHYDEPRRLAWAEVRTLCGVPPEWEIDPPTMKKSSDSPVTGELCQLELLRGVLPQVGSWLARSVKDGLALPALRKQEHRLVDLRDPENIVTYSMDLSLSSPVVVTEEKQPRLPGFSPPAPPPPPILMSAPPAGRFETSKKYIQDRLAGDGYFEETRPPGAWADRVAQEVRSRFPGRKTQRFDVLFVWRKNPPRRCDYKTRKRAAR